MSRPKRAVVLAAGFGTRMLPLTLDTPKPMLPLWGVPMLEHTLSLLERWGVSDVLINLHHHPAPILEFTRQRGHASFRISLSFEPEILGTGGALRKASWFLDDESFWMVNSDVAADLDPEPLVREMSRKETMASLWVHPSMGPRTVEIDNGNVVDFRSARPGTEGTFTFCGYQVIRPSLLDYLPETGFSSIVTAYESAMKNGASIRGVTAPGCFWRDVGTPEAYIAAHRETLKARRTGGAGKKLVKCANRARSLRKRGVKASGFVSAPEDCRIDPGAILHDCVIWSGAHITADAVVRHAVVGSNVCVRDEVRRMAVTPGHRIEQLASTDGQLWRVLTALRWRGHNVVIMPFEARGSARSFTRLRSGRVSRIMIRYSEERDENAMYAGHARFLKKIGVNVPEVILDFPASRVTVFEDLGDTMLQHAVEKMNRRALMSAYRKTIMQLSIMHSRGARAAKRQRLKTVPPFGPELYAWERMFFMKHFLRGVLSMSREDCDRIVTELKLASDRMLTFQNVLAHRDMQSSNVLLRRGQAYLIDFQGMRFGPAEYDLASLLFDPYVALDEDIQNELLDCYNKAAGRSIPMRDVHWAAAQRVAQALGAYGRLSSDPATAWFSRYIEPAIGMMHRAVLHIDELPALRALTAQHKHHATLMARHH